MHGQPVLWNRKGSVAEWLGSGLQNLVQRFESARNLSESRLKKLFAILLMLVIEVSEMAFFYDKKRTKPVSLPANKE
jgi:hypothetical protein